MSFIRKRPLENGKTRYYPMVKTNGKCQSCGGFNTKRDSEAALRQVECEIAKGTYGRANPTFKEFYEQWIDAKTKSLKASTLDDYKSTYRLHILPTLGDLKIQDISPLLTQEWIDGLSKKNCGPATVNKAFRYFKNCINNAIAKEIIDRSPCRGVIVPKLERRELVILTVDEANRLLESAKERERTLFAVLAFSGLRVAEGRGLKWKDIDFDKMCIRVERTFGKYGWSTPKTATSRRAVPLTPALTAILKKYRDNRTDIATDHVVFGHDGIRPLDESNVRRDFNAALQAAGLKHVTINSLRHFYASNMLASGCSIKFLQHALGHASASMTLNVYSHLIPESGAEAVTRFDARVNKQVTLLSQHQKKADSRNVC